MWHHHGLHNGHTPRFLFKPRQRYVAGLHPIVSLIKNQRLGNKITHLYYEFIATYKHVDVAYCSYTLNPLPSASAIEDKAAQAYFATPASFMKTKQINTTYTEISLDRIITFTCVFNDLSTNSTAFPSTI